MLSKFAINNFLNRKLDNWDWLKETSPRELDKYLNKLDPPPYFHTKPYNHQLACFLLGLKNPYFLYLLGLGSGKSKIVLDLIKYRKDKGEIRSSLICVPYLVHMGSWADEIEKHQPDLSYIILDGSLQRRWGLLENTAVDLYIINYAGLVSLTTDLIDNKHIGGRRKSGRSRIVNKKSIASISLKFDALIYDECFPTGTPITTPTGFRNIEDIKVGDLVYSSDGLRPVRYKFVGKSNKLVKLHLEDGRSVVCTPNHPFFTDVGWLPAKKLLGEYVYAKQEEKSNRANERAEEAPRYIRRGVDYRVCGSIGEELYKRFSYALQNRYRQSISKDRDRSRWEFPQTPNKKRTRYQEGMQVKRTRVVHISSLELRSPVDVFNLEIESTPHYYANGILVHNSQALKSWKSLTFQVCRDVGACCKYRYGLTGTPMSRDPQDLWAQFYTIDRGVTLGPTLGLFRGAFFVTKRNFWGTYEHTFKQHMELKLHTIMKHRSIRYALEDIQDLPPKVYIKKHVDFPAETIIYYREIVNRLIQMPHEYQALDNYFLRMRQLSSGFLHYKNLETGEIFSIDFDENPKLEMLMCLVEGLPDNRKMVIFNEYITSGNKICARLKEMKISHARLYGGTKDPRRELEKFTRDINCRILVNNNQSGSSGLNLQIANYVVFYESPVSPIVRAQAEKRCHREGQTKRVFYYDLLVRNSIDQKILDYIKEGKDIFEALIEGKMVLNNRTVERK